jgi:hypothetical protein
LGGGAGYIVPLFTTLEANQAVTIGPAGAAGSGAGGHNGAPYPAGALYFVAIPAGQAVQEGWLYSAGTGAFSAPPAPPASPQAAATLMPLEFMVYLQAEAGLTNAQIALLRASTDPNVGTLIFMLQMAGRQIVPGGQLVTQGLALLVAEGILTSAQSAAVIANWPSVLLRISCQAGGWIAMPRQPQTLQRAQRRSSSRMASESCNCQRIA